ncbi:energy transducer TonB [Lysobacter gummosus]|uniref:TonB family protein n=1 Tax=Lysobacter gummosus TaxID=262324 RepID=A0ABY3XDP9_9GAMM|nr:energy transducer TonB [Lysobacter gummosus]UNP28896.1 TonB family protein [Lysobacter gummosus]
MKVVTKPARIVAAGLWACGGMTIRASARVVFGASVGLSVLLAGCGSGESSKAQPAASAQAEAAEAAAPLPPALTEFDADGLRARAAQALREQRIHTPAGDSAVDYYLALRDKEAGQIDVISALSELQPYVVIAGEQALLDDDLAESRRLQDLLARMDPQAPALPRLREGLRAAGAARERKAREETERLMAERSDASAARAVSAQRERTAAASTAMKAAAAASAQAADEAAAQASTPASTPAAPVPAPAVAAPPPVAASASARSAPAAKPMPRLIADASPRYPLSALNRRIEGSVEISFTIQPDGRTSAPRLVSSQPAGVFDEAALAAVSRLRFEASGQAHAARRTLNFKLPSR